MKDGMKKKLIYATLASVLVYNFPSNIGAIDGISSMFDKQVSHGIKLR